MQKFDGTWFKTWDVTSKKKNCYYSLREDELGRKKKTKIKITIYFQRTIRTIRPIRSFVNKSEFWSIEL